MTHNTNIEQIQNICKDYALFASSKPWIFQKNEARSGFKCFMSQNANLGRDKMAFGELTKTRAAH